MCSSDLLSKFELDILDTSSPEYKCYCSKDRVAKALISLGKDELLEMAEEESTEVSCHFCDKTYKFSSKEIKELAQK